jgi:peptidylprolyl isomerase
MKVNKDPDSLLQYALPLEETIGEQAAAPVRLLQQKVEATREQAQLRLWGQLSTSLNDAQTVYKKDKAKLLKPIVAERKAQAEAILTKLDTELQALDKAGQGAIDASAGSVQDIQGAAEVVERGRSAQALVGELEELMIPPGYVAPVPKDVNKYFPNLPRLDGRAKVALTFKRAPGSTEKKFNNDGKLYKEAVFEIVVDGWTAPLTGGNFIDLINRGFYDEKTVTRADGFIIQTGDSGKENGNGFKPEGAKKVRRIPLEVGLKGSKEALYSETVDEAGKVGIPLRMPFSADGTLAMARAEFDNDSASSQVFLFLFESDMTPAGKNFMDGRYTTFGYTVKGAEFLRQVREGDVITSAKVLSGLDNLKA